MADHTCNNHHTCSVKLDGISSIHFGSVAGRGSWCGCGGGWYTWAQSAHHTFRCIKVVNRVLNYCCCYVQDAAEKLHPRVCVKTTTGNKRKMLKSVETWSGPSCIAYRDSYKISVIWPLCTNPVTIKYFKVSLKCTI